MNVLVACEYSGVVRDSFSRIGHNSWSCDLLPTEKQGNHYQGDVFGFIHNSGIAWDLIIAHPPCTDLAVSGARHFERKRIDGSQKKSIDFFMEFTKINCKKSP